MSLLNCEEVTSGLRESERTVAVRDIHGKKHYLRVDVDFLTERAGRTWLPVAKIHEDPKGYVLIELPQEAETGANRLWVRSTDLLESATATT